MSIRLLWINGHKVEDSINRKCSYTVLKVIKVLTGLRFNHWFSGIISFLVFFHCLEFQFLHCFSQATSFSVQRQQFSIFCSLPSYKHFLIHLKLSFPPSNTETLIDHLGSSWHCSPWDPRVMYCGKYSLSYTETITGSTNCHVELCKAPFATTLSHVVTGSHIFTDSRQLDSDFFFSFLSNSRKHESLRCRKVQRYKE